MDSSIKHDDLMRALGASLREDSGRMVWEDMQMGPSGSRRPDVYTIQKSYTRPLPTAYECKISVSDFRSDVTSGKWQEYLQFAGAVYFVTPRGLIQKSDVPDGAGLIWFYPESGFFKKMKAPTYRAVVLPQEALLKLLIDGVKRTQLPMRNAQISAYQVMDAVRRKVGEDVANYLRDKDNVQHQLNAMQENLKYHQGRLNDIQKSCREKEDDAYKLGCERAESVRRDVETEWKHLLEVLGLKDDPGRWAVRSIIANLKDNLTESTEVRRLQKVIADICRVINSAANSPSGTVQVIEAGRS